MLAHLHALAHQAFTFTHQRPGWAKTPGACRVQKQKPPLVAEQRHRQGTGLRQGCDDFGKIQPRRAKNPCARDVAWNAPGTHLTWTRTLIHSCVIRAIRPSFFIAATSSFSVVRNAWSEIRTPQPRLSSVSGQ